MREINERHPKSRPLREITHFIKEWRKHRKMTVEAVAERAGLTASMISQLERGRSAYTQNSLEAVAGALGVDAWQLLCPLPGTNAGVAVAGSIALSALHLAPFHYKKVEQAVAINADAARRIAAVLLMTDDIEDAPPAG